MEIKLSKTEETLVLMVSGRLDANTITAFEQEVEGAFTDKWSAVIVDLAALEYVSSIGISAFLKIAKRQKAIGGSFALRGAYGAVRKVLEMSGLLAIFPDSAGTASPLPNLVSSYTSEAEIVELSVHDNALQRAQDFVVGFARSGGMAAEQLAALELVVEEIVTNIVRCAYPEGEGPLSIACAATDEVVSVTFSDAGTEFNPLAQREPELDLAIEDRPIGGLGIFLVKKIAQKVEYRREGLRNYFTVWICKSSSPYTN